MDVIRISDTQRRSISMWIWPLISKYCICWRIRLHFTLNKTGQKAGVVLYAESAARMPAGCAVILYVALATYSI